MRLATWNEATAWLSERHPVLARKDDWMCLGWPAARPQQTLQLQRVTARGRERILLCADVMSATNLSAAAVLLWNGRILDGALAVFGGVLTLRLFVTLSDLGADAFGAAIDSLRNDAMRLRGILAPKETAHLFMAFAE